VATLVRAYSMGIFPWYNDFSPILWWSPDPRFVLRPVDLKVSRSLGKTLRNPQWKVTFDHDFPAVVEACASLPRSGQGGTWITWEMQVAYGLLHEAGYAHSVEVQWGGELVGGLYGVAIGRAFFGESMFHRVNDASKVALVHLVEWLKRTDFALIDCQQKTQHLGSLGATEWPRATFLDAISSAVAENVRPGKWNMPPH